MAIEQNIRKKGFKKIAGVDEAGRGPLAGPVVAAACIIAEGVFFEGINDSKLLTAKKRSALFEQITTHDKVYYGVGMVSEKIIDQINIYQATILAMKKAISSLKEQPDYIIVDGLHLPEYEHCEKIVQGDARAHAIAAASIIAKCTRDTWMIKLHALYPQYGFDENKGYGTVKHFAALLKHGPCPCHRSSFSPIKEDKTCQLL